MREPTASESLGTDTAPKPGFMCTFLHFSAPKPTLREFAGSKLEMLGGNFYLLVSQRFTTKSPPGRHPFLWQKGEPTRRSRPSPVAVAEWDALATTGQQERGVKRGVTIGSAAFPQCFGIRTTEPSSDVAACLICDDAVAVRPGYSGRYSEASSNSCAGRYVHVRILYTLQATPSKPLADHDLHRS